MVRTNIRIASVYAVCLSLPISAEEIRCIVDAAKIFRYLHVSIHWFVVL